jgi:alpha-methylacyl-CoA racemase
MKERLTAIFKSAARDHWEALFDDTDDCVWPVLSMSDAPAHPHNVARQAFVDIAGVRQPAPAPRLSRTPGDIQSPPPLLGEHSRQQLSSLGLPDEEIERLARAGVISDPVSP